MLTSDGTTLKLVGMVLTNVGKEAETYWKDGAAIQFYTCPIRSQLVPHGGSPADWGAKRLFGTLEQFWFKGER